MPERCGAKNRRGEPCQKPPVPGKKRCRLHGGLSTGPKTAEGKMAAANAHVTHGLTRKFESYEQLLASGQVAEFELAPSKLDLTPEIRLARARLGRATRLLAEIEAGEGEGAILKQQRKVAPGVLRDQADRALGRLIRLASVQKRIAPGADAGGPLTLTVKVVDGRKSEEPKSEVVPASTEEKCS
jgi:hypothetical protein